VQLDESVGDWTAEAILDAVEGRFRGPATTPEYSTAVTVDIAYTGGQILACDEAEQPGASTFVPPGPRLDVPVDITISSEDGAFDEETRQVYVKGHGPGRVTTQFPMYSNEFNGSPGRLIRQVEAGFFEEPGGAFDGPHELVAYLHWSQGEHAGAVLMESGVALLDW